ncbi:MAG TPA: hypothetical protein VFV33_25565 [Gemmatimonadaceae bacterium]|nr:hypothetical protein [Gemmatimonadaceae bacterium]
MRTQRYTIHIGAPPQIVWDTMLSHGSYEEWTTAFSIGSTYEGRWETGARIRFFATDGHGVISEVAESRPPEHVSIRHLGMLVEGVEDFDSPAVKAWAPAYEHYTIRPTVGGSELSVVIDIAPESASPMSEMWTKALAKLKSMCEARVAG